MNKIEYKLLMNEWKDNYYVYENYAGKYIIGLSKIKLPYRY